MNISLSSPPSEEGGLGWVTTPQNKNPRQKAGIFWSYSSEEQTVVLI